MERIFESLPSEAFRSLREPEFVRDLKFEWADLDLSLLEISIRGFERASRSTSFETNHASKFGYIFPSSAIRMRLPSLNIEYISASGIAIPQYP